MQVTDDEALATWLDAFAQCVRSGDLAGGRALFSDDALGFGTVASEYSSAQDLMENQWAVVWPRTQDFGFDEVRGSWSDGNTFAVAATWSSVGTDAVPARRRAGRVTLLLRRSADGSLRAVHSHFSMLPGTTA